MLQLSAGARKKPHLGRLSLPVFYNSINNKAEGWEVLTRLDLSFILLVATFQTWEQQFLIVVIKKIL